MEDALALDRRVPAVSKVAPLSIGSVRVSFGERSREFTVLGTTHEMLDVRGLHVGVGRYLPIGVRDAPLCVIGPKVQRELFANESPLGKILRLGDNRFRVIGVMQPRGTSIGMNLDEVVHVPVDTGLRMFNETSLFRLLLELNSHEDISRAKQAVIDLLKERHAGQEDVTVLTQDAVLATFNKLLVALTGALVAIAAISLAVAGIGIMNVMLVSVAERTREIGLLKAVGVTSKQVVAVFLTEAAVISTAGGVIGLILGVGAGQLFQHLQPDFPVRPPMWAVVAALFVSTAVGFVFGSVPARRAARLDPVNALMRKRA